MPRQARVVIPGLPHHVTHRGNNRQDIFFVDDDRIAYLGILDEQLEQYSVRLWGFCLMTNHVHLIVTPATEDALQKAIGRAHFAYANLLNRLHGRSGHLWQERFYSCPMDEAYAIAAMRYVERNPVRARIVRAPWLYRWSSAAAHTGRGKSRARLDMPAWNAVATDINWSDWLTQDDNAELVQDIRRCTHIGRPLATDSLLSKLETTLGRRLRPLPVGRPRKQKKANTK